MRTTLLCALGLTMSLGCIVVPEGLVVGNGTQTVQSRGVGDFHTVTNLTSLQVRVREAPSYEVLTTIDSNLQDMLLLEVSGGELTISVRPVGGIHPTGNPLVDLYLPNFLGATTKGSGSMSIDNVTGAKDLALATYGSGSMRFDGTARRLDANTWGSGGITLSGSADLLVAGVHGSGGIDARDFLAHSVDLGTWASGSVLANVNGGEIRAHIYGSGSIDYWGSGVLMLLEDYGSGDLHWHGE